jgi:hypothetical protein
MLLDCYPPTTLPTDPRASTDPDPFLDLFYDTQYVLHEPSHAPGPPTSAGPSHLSGLSGLSTTFPPLPSSKLADPKATDDDSYFQFFLSELPKCFPYVTLFPWTAATLFSTSRHHPALQHSVVAVAALIAGSGGNTALSHLVEAVHLLKTQLGGPALDDGLAITSFLLAHFAIMKKEIPAVKKHLRGLSLVLSRVAGNSPDGRFFPSPLTTDKLTVLIWRMAVRMDFIASVVCGPGPVLPK